MTNYDWRLNLARYQQQIHAAHPRNLYYQGDQLISQIFKDDTLDAYGGHPRGQILLKDSSKLGEMAYATATIDLRGWGPKDDAAVNFLNLHMRSGKDDYDKQMGGPIDIQIMGDELRIVTSIYPYPWNGEPALLWDRHYVELDFDVPHKIEVLFWASVDGFTILKVDGKVEYICRDDTRQLTKAAPYWKVGLYLPKSNWKDKTHYRMGISDVDVRSYKWGDV